jgi:hypothetical protein
MNVGNTLQDGGIMTLCRVDSTADFDCAIRSDYFIRLATVLHTRSYVE